MSITRPARDLHLRPRRLRDVAWALVWGGAIAFVEIVGRTLESELTDLLLLAGLVSLLAITVSANARDEIAWARAGTELGTRLRAMRGGFWGTVGVDLRGGGGDIAAGLPRPRLHVLAGVACACACAVALAAAPWLPEGLRTVGRLSSYSLFLVVSGALWVVAGLALLGLAFYAAGIVGDARIRRLDNLGTLRSGRSPSGRLVLGTFAAAVGLAILPVPAIVPAAGIVGCLVALAGLAALPRFRSVHIVWRRPGNAPCRAPFGVHLLAETTLVALACLTVVTLISGLEIGPPAALLPFGVRLGRAAAWAAVFGLGAIAWRTAALAAGAARSDPAAVRSPWVRLTSAPSADAIAALVADGWRIRQATDAPLRGEVVADPGERDLASHEGRLWLARRHQIVQRRLIRRGLQRLFRAAARFSYDKGSGFWIAPHLWLVQALARDEEEDDSISKGTGAIDQVLGPDHEHAFPLSARAHLRRVLDAADVDLVFVEDGVGWAGVRQVLGVLLEVYDMHGGTRRIEDRDFSGLTGLRIVVHDFDLDNPYRAEGYPEPDYEDVARARLLHVFRDRGGEEVDVRAPAPGDRVPLLV